MNEYERLVAYMKILYHNLTTLHRNLAKDDACLGIISRLASGTKK